jgi:hypothetical protein
MVAINIMPIKDKDGKEVSEAAVLKQYFGMKPQQTLQEFMDEIRKLSPLAKQELANGAAKELGYIVE